MRRIFWTVYVAAAGLLIAAQIFWPPPVGIANNGDFSKVAGYYDLGPESGTEDEYKYFVTDFVFAPQFHWRSRIFSSEHIFVWPAVKFSRAFSSGRHFDIRVLGFAHWMWMVLAFSGAALAFSGLNLGRAICLAIFTLFVFTDVAYACLLNSFYTDTATMLFLFSTIVLAVLYIVRPNRHLLWTILLAVSGILLISSKVQHAVLGIPLCLLAVGNSLQSTARARIVWIFVAVAWLATILFMTGSSDPQYKTQPLFTTIFYKIAKSSSDPGRDLQELGLGPEYLRYRGLFAYSEAAPMRDAKWRETFLEKTGFGKLLLFYARHPQRALRFVWGDLQEFGPRNPDPGLPNYRRQEGLGEGKLSPHFGGWHTLRTYLFKRFPFHIVVVLGIALIFCAACCISAAIRVRFPAWLSFAAVVLMALLALAVATLGDAADTGRHLFIFHVLTDLVLCFGVAGLARFARS